MSVAYTIKRNGNYHINVRIGSHIFRKSLATDSRKVAKIMVDKFIPIITELREKGDTSDEQVLKVLSTFISYLIERVQKRFNAVIYPLSRDADDELFEFESRLPYFHEAPLDENSLDGASLNEDPLNEDVLNEAPLDKIFIDEPCAYEDREAWNEYVDSQRNDPNVFRNELLDLIAPVNISDKERVQQSLESIIDSKDPLYSRVATSFLKVFGEFRKIRIALEYNNEPSARSMMDELLDFSAKTRNSWKGIQEDNEEEHALKLEQSSIDEPVSQVQHDEPVSQIQHNALSGSTNMTLEELFNEYIDAHSKKRPPKILVDADSQTVKPKIMDADSEKWKPKILKDNQRKSELLLILLGRNTLISQISGLELDIALSTALSLPKRNISPYNKYTAEACVSIAQLDEIDDDVRVKPKTIKEHKKFLQSCFRFALYQRYISISPTNGMLLRFPKTSTRGCFSNSEVRKILDYCSQQTDTLWRWAIPIMAYTGMRNSEVMQLRKVDIKTDPDSGINYIHITKKAGSVKTQAGIRRVPIHNALLDAGFLDFVDSVESRENTLFNGDGRTLTRMYATLKSKINLPDLDMAENQLTLYSLRHRVVTSLLSFSVPVVFIQAMVGHKISGFGQTIDYSHLEQLTIPQLKAEIDKLSY